MAANKRAVYSVVQLFIWFREFVHSVFRSFVFTGERFVDRLIGKVTGIPLEVLASKRCSASDLNCRYLNPYIKIRLIAMANKLYQEF